MVLEANQATGGSSGRGSAVTDLDDDDRRLLMGLAEVLDQFESMRPNIPLHQVKMLVKLALDEGKSQKYYSEKWEYPPSTVSRAMLDLGMRTRKGEEGLGLVDFRTSAHSLREHEVFLSTKGKGLLSRVLKRLSK
jgi:DNA-binding MarR family transcriptional regulator